MTAVLGFDPVVALALALCLLAVVGSLLPLVPGAAFSVGGVLLYWWHTGYADPGALVLAGLLGLALLALVLDWFGGAVSASAGGASTRTTLAAAAVALPLTLLAGPVGLLIGVAGTVFLLTYRENDDVEASARVAAYATVGMLASAVAQAMLTGLVLLGTVLVVAY
ncbi:DUF456 domain-containing protein [Halobacteriales archaeon QS_5_70_15]|nr:MAG: DUF456 domain-containing protein [Halobacteriales archaeon QS_5_70_15]